jgi:hypothetical protein
MFHFMVGAPNAAGQTEIRAGVTLPGGVTVDEATAEKLDRAFHDAMERVLAPLWKVK